MTGYVAHIVLTLMLTTSSIAFHMRHFRDSPLNWLCDGKFGLKSYLFLNKLCEDCFGLFRDPDVFAACRSDCFSSTFFDQCMTLLLTDVQTKNIVKKLQCKYT